MYIQYLYMRYYDYFSTIIANEAKNIKSKKIIEFVP